MKHLFPFLILLSAFSCGTKQAEEKQFEVNYYGALKNMTHKGDIAAKANLKDLKKSQNLYALGALENLKGEILILNSKPFISVENNEALSIDNTFEHKATLLVYASVKEWESSNIPENIISYEELENHISQKAKELGIDTEKPFPFLLKGKAKSFDWHVINWKDGDTGHSHEKHINSGLNGTATEQEVEILGFYSNKHHAIFTHHSTNMHLHVKTTDNRISGHVDGLTLGKGMTLELSTVN